MVAFLARRYAEAIEVIRGDDAPARFVWRGRHYTVRAVLAHWVRTGTWWEAGREQMARLMTGDDAAASDPPAELQLVPMPPAPRWGQRAWGEPAPDVGVSVVPAEVDDDEREFWRVEASIGRSGMPAVVELCFAWSTGTWTIDAVMD